MKKRINASKNLKKAFSVIEVILAAAIFCIFSTTVVIFLLGSLQSQVKDEQYRQALNYVRQGAEAVRAIRDQSFDNLQNVQSAGLKFNDNHWIFEGDSDTSGIYERKVTIETIRRNNDSSIVAEGGDEDINGKKVVVSVSWNTREGGEASVEITEYLMRWK